MGMFGEVHYEITTSRLIEIFGRYTAKYQDQPIILALLEDLRSDCLAAVPD
jgi:hypothetical protein